MSGHAIAMASDERAAVCICGLAIHSRRCDRHARKIADLYAVEMARAQARTDRPHHT